MCEGNSPDKKRKKERRQDRMCKRNSPHKKNKNKPSLDV